MKRAIAILVILSLSIQCITQLSVIAWYEINKDYIAKNLCENRDKPQLKCCGKCYLHKQLKKVSENGESSDRPGSQKSEQLEWVVFLIPEPINISSACFTSAKNYYSKSQTVHRLIKVTGIFRPPQNYA